MDDRRPACQARGGPPQHAGLGLMRHDEVVRRSPQDRGDFPERGDVLHQIELTNEGRNDRERPRLELASREVRIAVGAQQDVMVGLRVGAHDVADTSFGATPQIPRGNVDHLWAAGSG